MEMDKSQWILHQKMPPEIPLPAELHPDVIKQNSEDLTKHGAKIVKSLNRILYDEINGLK